MIREKRYGTWCLRIGRSLVTIFFILLGRVEAVTFTSPVTISETDTTSEGQDIVVNGATVAINGANNFCSLLPTNGADIPHQITITGYWLMTGS